MALSWYQESLFTNEVTEVRIRVGIVPGADHVQVMVESFDPTTMVLTAQWSNPHLPLRAWLDALEQAAEVAEYLIERAASPF